jgi:hypothetical protein
MLFENKTQNSRHKTNTMIRFIIQDSWLESDYIGHAAAEYEAYEGTYPTEEQLSEYIRNRNEMHHNPSDYCVNKCHHIPAVGIGEVASDVCSKADQKCSICCHDISEEQHVITIPTCKHIFHANESECLGVNASIRTWLTKCNTCPNCNAKVSFVKPSYIVID